jgi:DNA-damage-inducible protein D
MTKETAIKLFESKKIRSYWDAEKEKWYFSIIDIINILTDSPRSRKYWNALKTKLQQEGSELSHNLGQLKMEAEDGKVLSRVAQTQKKSSKNSNLNFTR